MRAIAAGVAGVLVAGGVACGRLPRESTGIPHDYPTLEPDDRPIDPYADLGSGGAAAGPALVSWEDGEGQPVIRVRDEIGDARVVEAMVVRIRADGFRVPEAPNQRVEVGADGVQRVTTRVGPGRAVTRAERKAALASTSMIDSDHALVRQIAREAVGGERDPRRRVAKLVAWIDQHITYEILDEVSASGMLARGRGDCNEQSILFVALARAIQLPARRAVGLVPTRTTDDAPAFALHAWAEVAIDGRWVPVDPTWNEPIADAAHITFAVGAEGDAEVDHAAMHGLAMAVVDITRGPGGIDDPRALARALPVHLELRRR